jgi:hypothetical protein
VTAQSTLFETPETWEAALLRDLAPLIPLPPGVSIHLAIMVQPYMGRVQRGEKTIESRWAMDQRTPWKKVAVGDIIVFKLSGGAFLGWAVVERVEDLLVNGEALRLVSERPGLGVDAGFAASVAHKNYVTFAHLGPFNAVDAEHVTCGKRDQRGWVVLRSRT